MDETKRALSQGVDVMFNSYLGMAITTLIIGLVLIFWPGLTVASVLFIVALLFGFWGVFLASDALQSRGRGESWFWQLVGGLLSLGTALYIIFQPQTSVIVTTIIIALWFLLMGVLRIVGSIAHHKELDHAAFSVLLGVVMIVIGLMLFRNPETGIMSFITVIGWFQVIIAAIIFIQAFQFKNAAQAELGLTKK